MGPGRPGGPSEPLGPFEPEEPLDPPLQPGSSTTVFPSESVCVVGERLGPPEPPAPPAPPGPPTGSMYLDLFGGSGDSIGSSDSSYYDFGDDNFGDE